MKEAIKQLILKWACKHSWKIEFSRNVNVREEGEIIRTYTNYIYVCENCGKFKRVKSS